MPALTKTQTLAGPASKSDWIYATKPTRWTLFWRTFLPWQIWRFLWINAKMVRIIGRSHIER